MDTPLKPKSTSYLPHFCSLVALPICYTSVLLHSDQQLLAVCAAALGVIFAFLVCRTVQRRGQVSLAVTIFVLPLLVAGSCAILLQLTPFVNRQRSIAALRAAGVGFQARPPDQTGEWLQNRSGTMLPVWIAKTIGSDCLSEIRSIDGELGAFQSISYGHLDVSRLNRVTFKQQSKNSHVTNDLVDWLNACPRLDQVYFDFSYFSDQDGQALSRLADNRRSFVTIRNCESVVDLTSLKEVAWLHLVGNELLEPHARYLSQVADIPSLVLEIHELSSEAISALRGYQGYVSMRCGVAPDRIVDFAKLGLNSVELSNLPSVPLESAVELQGLPKTRYLRIIDSKITASECIVLASLFQCETLALINITMNELNRDASIPVLPGDTSPTPKLVPSPEQVDLFWMLPNLTEIQIYDGSWKHLKRPGQTGSN